VFDPVRASALLSAAHAGGITFTCLVPANFAVLERVALILQQQLGDAGIRVRLESLQPDTVNKRVVSGDFDAAVLPILGGPSATVFHRFWHSPAGTPRWNFWGYRDARVDAALDAALDARDDRQFGEAIRRFEAAVRDNPPAVFLAWNETVQAISRRFRIPDGNEGRDAIYVLSRWLLRGPEGGTP
jgi:ABC-type transport system substrate-binding protein